MQKIVVKSENLAPIMYMDKSLEIVPEPFRCQRGRLSLIIDFEEYVDYLRHYSSIIPHARGNHLRTRELIGNYDKNDLNAKKELFSKFMLDMALAVGKELHYCTAYSKGGTSITHRMSSTNVMGVELIHNLYEKSASYLSYDYLQLMESMEFPIDKASLGENIDYYEYAVVCYYLADKELFWSFT